VEEHHLDTVGVGSSILPVPTALPAGVIFSFSSMPAWAALMNRIVFVGQSIFLAGACFIAGTCTDARVSPGLSS
jgi:hypothetical protein